MLIPKYSNISKSRLSTCDERLQRVFNEVIKGFDCIILVGYRNQEDQDRAFAQGKSKVKFPNGKHNKQPSEAVDASPFPVIWPDRNKDPKRYVKTVARFYLFAGYVIATARQMGIHIRWGGDWDGDFDIFDQTFDDLCHFELKEG